MPDTKALATAQRLLLVLDAVRRLSGGPSRRWVQVGDVVKALKEQGYKAETHSIRRDLDALRDLYPQLECHDNSRGDAGPKRGLAYGYRWAGGSAPLQTGLTLAEALSLALVERHLREALPATLTGALGGLFDKARRTLDLHDKSPAAHWPDKIVVVPPAQPLLPPTVAPGVRAAVHEALIETRRLKVTYRKLSGDETPDLVLHPLGLIQRGPTAYLAALAFQYDNVLLYALHRIASAEKLNEPARAPADFDLGKYAEEQGHFGSGEAIRLEARVSKGLRSRLEETRLAEDQVLSGPDENDWHTLTATVRDTWQLRWWIAAQMEQMVVVEPGGIREKIMQGFSDSTKNYEDK